MSQKISRVFPALSKPKMASIQCLYVDVRVKGENGYYTTDRFLSDMNILPNNESTGKWNNTNWLKRI